MIAALNNILQFGYRQWHWFLWKYSRVIFSFFWIFIKLFASKLPHQAKSVIIRSS